MSTQSERAFLATGLEDKERLSGQPAVAGLVFFPIKSGRPHFASKLYSSREGLKSSAEADLSDRQLMVTNLQGKMESQRSIPAMALLEVSVQGKQVTITFRADEAHESLRPRLAVTEPTSISFTIATQSDEQHAELGTRVHKTADIPAIDQGDAVAAWLSDVLGEPVRLVFQKPEQPREREETIPGLEHLKILLRFADSYPSTALSFTTLGTLNEHLQRVNPDWPQFEAISFRMNLLFSGDINEHTLVGKFLKIGEAYFYVYRVKERCPLPAVDQRTGEVRGGKTFATEYRRELASIHDQLAVPENQRFTTTQRGELRPKDVLGVDLVPINEGTIRVGDHIEVLDELPHDLEV